MKPSTVIQLAADLLSADGENKQYDRAITEMTCAVLAVSTDDISVIEWLIRAEAAA